MPHSKYATRQSAWNVSVDAATWPRDGWMHAGGRAAWMHDLGLPLLERARGERTCRMAVYTGKLNERWGPNWQESEWALCDDLKPPCLVFSVGIGNNWQFDLAAAARGCEVHSFDPTPELRSRHMRNIAAYQRHGMDQIHFHYLGLGKTSANITSDYGRRGLGPVAHLDELMRMFAKGRRVDVLKIDCEGCEWEELAHLATSAPTALCAVSMLQFEWHFTSRLRFRAVADARIAFRHLRRTGFRPTAILQGASHPPSHPPTRARASARASDSPQTVATALAKEAHGIEPNVCCYTVHLRRHTDSGIRRGSC